MKILTIIGARPQFIKAAALSAKIAEMRRQGARMEEVIVHTGQHYDAGMSDVFFKDLGIPREKYNLKTGSASHAVQTARMMPELEEIIIFEKPDFVLIYGDTNSTLAGALVASKLKVRIAHVEAGMRSFNRNMPEEINRVLSDHVAEINFCSTRTAVGNLRREGLAKTAKLVGDIMFDTSLLFAGHSAKIESTLLHELGVKAKKFVLMTCHRAENTDEPKRLREIISAANEISRKLPVIFPVHPRTVKIIDKLHLKLSPGIRRTAPLGYLEAIALEKNALMLMTDSGGMQKEAFFFATPCITMRDETEWVETVDAGMNEITGADKRKILAAFAKFAKFKTPTRLPRPYGDGRSSEKILKSLLSNPRS